jgi:hypothetical protein
MDRRTVLNHWLDTITAPSVRYKALTTVGGG